MISNVCGSGARCRSALWAWACVVGAALTVPAAQARVTKIIIDMGAA